MGCTFTIIVSKGHCWSKFSPQNWSKLEMQLAYHATSLLRNTSSFQFPPLQGLRSSIFYFLYSRGCLFHCLTALFFSLLVGHLHYSTIEPHFFLFLFPPHSDRNSACRSDPMKSMNLGSRSSIESIFTPCLCPQPDYSSTTMCFVWKLKMLKGGKLKKKNQQVCQVALF